MNNQSTFINYIFFLSILTASLILSYFFRDRGGLELHWLGTVHGKILVIVLRLREAPDLLRLREAEHGLGLLLTGWLDLHLEQGGLLLGVREILVLAIII